MRVVVGLRSFHPGRIGGIETYIRELLKAWGETRREDEWIVLVNPGSAPTFSSPGPWMRFVTAGEPHDIAAWQRQAESFAPALYFSPMTVIDPPTVGLPAVVTIPDLQHLFLPEFYDEETLRFRALHYPLSARRAEAVLTLSAHAAESIIEKLGVPADRVHGIPLAPGEEFRRPVAESAVRAFRERHGLPERFAFYPANFWPHKNHAGLFSALAMCRRAGEPLTVALSGFAGGDQERVRRLIRHHGLGDSVRTLGYLERSEIPVAYAAAEFLVFPSLFEGYGIPVAEAMAASCPVACSRVTSIPEFAGDAALFFDPRRPEEIANAMRRLRNDPSLRASLVARGREQIAKFSWKATADRTYEVLSEVHRRRFGGGPARAVILPLNHDGEVDRARLPPPGERLVLHFLRPGSTVDAATVREARDLFGHRGVSGAVGAVEFPDGSTDGRPFDIIRLKQEDYLPLERIWIGPNASDALLAWLRSHPAVSPYEIVLQLATHGMLIDAPALLVRASSPSPPSVAPAAGAVLSRDYFGLVDTGWLRNWAVRILPAWLPVRLRRSAVPLVAELLHLRLTGEPAAGWRNLLFSGLRRDRPTPPTVDGWIGRTGMVTCSPAADGQLRLSLDSPAWPLRRPPVVSVYLDRRRLYHAPLPARGRYELAWPWPEDAANSLILKIKVNRVFVPAEHGMGDDSRRLSLRIIEN